MVQKGESASFSILVATARFLKATDPQDFVYAFHGLATDVDENEDLLKPNYKSVTVLDVYRTSIEHSVRTQKRLDRMRIRHITLDPPTPAGLTGFQMRRFLTKVDGLALRNN